MTTVTMTAAGLNRRIVSVMEESLHFLHFVMFNPPDVKYAGECVNNGTRRHAVVGEVVGKCI